MELNQIRYFVTLAALLHFTRAAEACHVSQPALTKSIQKLEDELGGPLLHRERSRTQLTDLGRLMLGPMQRMLNAARDASQQAEAFRKSEACPPACGPETTLQGYGIDLARRQGEGSCLLSLPSTFVVGQDGVIVHAHASGDVANRMEPDTII